MHIASASIKLGAETQPTAPVTAQSSTSWFRLWRSLVSTRPHSPGVWASLPPSAKAVFIVLSAYVNDNERNQSGMWLAWPSIRLLAAKAGLKRRAAQYALRRLKRFGMIKVLEGGGKKTNVYELLPPTAWAMHDNAPVHDDAPLHGNAPECHAHTCTGSMQERAPKKERVKEFDPEKEKRAADILESASDVSAIAAARSVGVDDGGICRLAQAVISRKTSVKRIDDVVENLTARGLSDSGGLAIDLMLHPEKKLSRPQQKQAPPDPIKAFLARSPEDREDAFARLKLRYRLVAGALAKIDDVQAGAPISEKMAREAMATLGGGGSGA